MPSTHDLAPLLTEWRLLSEQEGNAIARDDWRRLAEHQARKTQLQAQITRLIKAPDSPAPTAASEPESPALAGTVRELITLEERNRDDLAAKCHLRHTERLSATRTLQDLQHVRRAYGPTRGALWQSYS